MEKGLLHDAMGAPGGGVGSQATGQLGEAGSAAFPSSLKEGARSTYQLAEHNAVQLLADQHAARVDEHLLAGRDHLRV